MRRLSTILLNAALSILIIAGIAFAQHGQRPLRVRTEDKSVDANRVTIVNVSNGTLTKVSNSEVTLTSGGGGAAIGGLWEEVEFNDRDIMQPLTISDDVSINKDLTVYGTIHNGGLESKYVEVAGDTMIGDLNMSGVDINCITGYSYKCTNAPLTFGAAAYDRGGAGVNEVTGAGAINDIDADGFTLSIADGIEDIELCCLDVPFFGIKITVYYKTSDYANGDAVVTYIEGLLGNPGTTTNDWDSITDNSGISVFIANGAGNDYIVGALSGGASWTGGYSAGDVYKDSVNKSLFLDTSEGAITMGNTSLAAGDFSIYGTGGLLVFNVDSDSSYSLIMGNANSDNTTPNIQVARANNQGGGNSLYLQGSSGLLQAMHIQSTAGNVTAAGDVTAGAEMNIPDGGYLRLNGDGGNTSFQYSSGSNTIFLRVDGEEIGELKSSLADSNYGGIAFPGHASFGLAANINEKTIVDMRDQFGKDFDGANFDQWRAFGTDIQMTPDAGTSFENIQTMGGQFAAQAILTNSLTTESINRTDISFTAPGTITTVAGDFVAAGFQNNDQIRVTGSVNNNKWFKITNITSTVLTVTTDGEIKVATEAAGSDVTIYGGRSIEWKNEIVGSEVYSSAQLPDNIYYEYATIKGIAAYARSSSGGNNGRIGLLQGGIFAIEPNDSDAHILEGLNVSVSAINGNSINDIFGFTYSANLENGTTVDNNYATLKLYTPSMSGAGTKVYNGKVIDITTSLVSSPATIGNWIGLSIPDFTTAWGAQLTGNAYGIYCAEKCRMVAESKWEFRDTAIYINSIDDGHLDLTADICIDTNAGMVNKVSRYTTTQTLDATDHIVFCNTDGGAWVLTLPAGVQGTNYKIINSGTSGNDLEVDPNANDGMYGGSDGDSISLSDGEVINIHFDSTDGGWW